MNWPDAESLARAGVPVRRTLWPLGRTLVYAPGAGTVRAVAVIAEAGVIAVVRAGQFTQAEFEAEDWVAANLI